MGRLSQFIWCGLACTPTSVPGSRIVFILSRGCLEEEIKIKKKTGIFCKRGKERVEKDQACLVPFFLSRNFLSFLAAHICNSF